MASDLVDPNDRAYVDQIGDPGLREVVIASLQRHRVPERLRAGDPAPDATLHPADGGERVVLDRLLGGHPVALVFGSYT